MIIDQGEDLLGKLGIIMNFNDQTITWDTDTIPMKDRDACTLSSVEVLIDIMFIRAQINHKRSAMNILVLPIFLMMIISQQA
jgi:xylose isomerase